MRLSINEHFIQNIEIINKAIFDNKKNNKVFKKNYVEISHMPDLVYIDPPYFSPLSDNEYVRRYHFVEGLSKNWKGIHFQEDTKTKSLKVVLVHSRDLVQQLIPSIYSSKNM